MLTPLASLRTGLELRLGADARAWLHLALTDAADAARHRAGPGMPAWERHFVTAGRHCRGGGPHGGSDNSPHRGPDSGAEEATGPAAEPADAARVLLLHAAAPGTDTVVRLYTQGTADERRAVVLALPHLDPAPDTAPTLALVEDALRTNDTRLIAAALGPWSAAHLPTPQWRQGVLKCLFTGVPLRAVAGLEHRAAADPELARMLQDYARERSAAGRAVPADLDHALRLARAAPQDPAPARPAPESPAGPAGPTSPEHPASPTSPASPESSPSPESPERPAAPEHPRPAPPEEL
ncbi:EboA domain-containing protein [Streptomyces axinellae]|uniref:Sugar phosphate isomerase n=1 Tax=Streptomyces axinellae TaxID=552788 RepID=A0ABP6CWS7_9ACTN